MADLLGVILPDITVHRSRRSTQFKCRLGKMLTSPVQSSPKVTVYDQEFAALLKHVLVAFVDQLLEWRPF